MALLFMDGFDKYGPNGFNNATVLNTYITQEWTSSSITGADGLSIVTGLSSTGQALKLSANSNVTSIKKTLPGNYARLIGGFRFQSSLVNPAVVTLFDGVTAQCSIVINTTTGTISVYRGTETGTALGTSASSVTANTTHHIEWDITVNNTTGAYTIYLDGVSVLTGSSANTRNGSNNYANAIQFQAGRTVAASLVFTIDDVYVFDTSGSYNNAVTGTSPRIETQFPTADSAVQFSFGSGVIGAAGAYAGVTTTNAPGANQLALRKYTCPASGNLNSVQILPAASSATAKFKAVLYNDSGGAPSGAAVATGTEVVGCTNGTVLSLPFASGQALTGGTAYWIGYITDTSVALSASDANTLGYKASNTYGSGAPSGPTMTSGQTSWVIYGLMTGVSSNNWSAEQYAPSMGDNAYVYDSTVNHEDLYTFPALSVNPTTIHCMMVKGNIRRGAGSTPTVDFRAKSSSTTGSGETTGISVGASYVWAGSNFPTDPNLGTAWTASTVNAAVSGIKIAS